MNIKIAKSSYKNKDNKRAIIFDCSAKNYRKKINTGVFIDGEYFENEKFTIPISLTVTISKLKSKREDALKKFFEYNWSNLELENYLKKGIDIYSVEEYVKNDFIRNKSIITGNDYINVVKVFKKHLKKVNIHFNDILDQNTIFEFKTSALRSGVKSTSINSYIKKMGVIMNQARRDGFITKNFNIPKHIVERTNRRIKKVLFDKTDIIQSINNCEDIYQVQSVSILLMLIICGGMSPSDVMKYKVGYNFTKSDLLGSIIYEEKCNFLKFKKSNKGSVFKYTKLDYIKIKLIEIVKTLFYITHYKKYPFMLAAYSAQHEIFDFDIETNNNTYRNLWNFYQTKLKEVSKLRFSDAKSIYYKNLEEMSMNKVTADILFARVKEVEIIGHHNIKLLKENIETCENKISELISASELIQVIINRTFFLGFDLNEIYINNIKTPLDFSNFLMKINMYHKGL